MVRTKEYTANEIPIIHLQDAWYYICNPDNILSPEAIVIKDFTLYVFKQIRNQIYEEYENNSTCYCHFPFIRNGYMGIQF